MEKFTTVIDYINSAAKPGDIIIFSGRGILDGMNPEFKHETYKVLQSDKSTGLLFRAFGGRKRLRTSVFDQAVGVLSPAEFSALKT